MPVVVVESPAKAKTINKYLGDDYKVLASYGHVRDLPPKDGSVDPEHDFAMKWELTPGAQKHVREIAEALKGDNTLILATDPDREGEAISWHLEETLRKRRAIRKDTEVRRVVFNAITRSAVTEAMQAPRQIDSALVEAYLARRALDYLVGFTLSPILWRKLPGAKSAGRVQSVALRLIVEREREIEAFIPREYWTVSADLLTERGEPFTARLHALGGRRLGKFDLANEEAARLAAASVESRDLFVKAVESKPLTRNPAPPFMTSTLQQEAARKLGFGARQTMSAAQRLYEAGYITYMRTDGIDMAPEAVRAARAEIARRFGEAYVPKSPRIYKNKAKNAQEAHEAIRPTDMSLAPAKLPVSDPDQKRLYELIWKRTLASQMAAARLERTTVTIASPDGEVELRATGQVVRFEGFMKVYEEGRDEPSESDETRRLPAMNEGEKVEKKAVTPEQHFTQPPPRYSEATLVKRMEELGIGRPSTYATIVSTIQDRGYVRKEKGRFVPEDKGRLVTAFLENFFRRYVEYDFTAALENDLDEISAGRKNWREVLRRFWRDFIAAVEATQGLTITEVLEKLEDYLAPTLFPPRENGSDPRTCPACGTGRLSLRLSKGGGAFIGCSNYPECRYTRPIGGEIAEGDMASPEGKLLGITEDGLPVTLRTGRFGPYVQLGEEGADGGKPQRASVPKGIDPDDVDFALAMQLLSLPRLIGPHPEDGEPVEAGIGRYGPYVRHGRTYANLKDPREVFEIGMNRAVELLAAKKSRGRKAPEPLRVLGEHPEGGEVALMDGRYGPYVKWGKINATLPKDLAPDEVTLERALELVAEKAAKGGRRKSAAKKKTATKKATTGKRTRGKSAEKAAEETPAKG